MNPRINYEMTEADLEKILDACKPTPVMYLSGGVPLGSSPQENANRAWAELGNRMGFDSMTVEPISGKPPRFFTAVPTETSEQRMLRIEREMKHKREAEIAELRRTIHEAHDKLTEMGEIL